MPEISVIVPVYNTGHLLRKCVESILNQTFADFELFLVNDGSTDHSGQICEEYAAKDSRVKVIHQKNQGQSVARNNAIEQMQGSWVHFVDSDDWIHPQMLERLYDAAKKHNADISVCDYAETTGDDPEVTEDSLRESVWTPKDFYMQHFITATVPVAKLIRREVLGNNRFPVGKYIDDEYIIYRLLFAREKLVYFPAPLYAYYTNLESLTKRAWNPRRLDAWQAYEEQIAFFQEMGDEELVRFRYRGYLENGMVNLDNALQCNHAGQYDRVIQFIHKRMKNVIRRAWKAGAMDIWKDYDLLYSYYPYLSRLYRLYREIRYGGKWRKS